MSKRYLTLPFTGWELPASHVLVNFAYIMKGKLAEPTEKIYNEKVNLTEEGHENEKDKIAL